MTGFLTVLLAGILLPQDARADFRDWWLTPDQQGQRLYDRQAYTEAAEHFTTPDRIGAALFAAKDFEGAAAAWGRQRGPEGAYNRGNALVFLGRYDEAIASYQAALAERPDWTEAQENLVLAQARKAALSPPNEGDEGTGGQLGADEIVMNDNPGDAGKGEKVEIQAGDQPTDEATLRAMWLRRVETSPTDFLAAKFNAQLASREEGE